MRILSLIAVELFVFSLAACAGVGMTEDCEQDREWDLKIGGCTAVISSGQRSGKGLAVAYYNRGIAYRHLGEYRRAIEDYDQTLRLDPNFALAYNNRGNAYVDLGEYRRAIEDYDQTLRLDPNFALAYSNRGNAYVYLGDPARGIEDLDQALRLNPELSGAYNNRGNAYANLGEYRRAIEDYDQTLRLDPNFAVAYTNRAYARCALGQVEASLDDWGQVLRLGAGAAENIQRHLSDRGFYKGAINGDFDLASQKALREWTVAGCPVAGPRRHWLLVWTPGAGCWSEGRKRKPHLQTTVGAGAA